MHGYGGEFSLDLFFPLPKEKKKLKSVLANVAHYTSHIQLSM